MSSDPVAHVSSGPAGLSILVQIAWDRLLQAPGVSQTALKETPSAPAASNPRTNSLTAREWKAIERLDRQASGVISEYKAKRADHYELRQAITSASAPTGLRGLFSSKKAHSKYIEKRLGSSLEGLRDYFQRSIQPLLRQVWSSYGGKTFTVPEGARMPALLKLASLPKEKEGKVISVDYLKSRIEQLEPRSKASNFRVSKHSGPLAITMTRKLGDGPVTTLRFEQRRPGVVDVYLNGKRMVHQQKNVSLFTDDALKLASEFARGAKSMKVTQKRFTEYVVGSEAMFLKAQKAMEQADKKS